LTLVARRLGTVPQLDHHGIEVGGDGRDALHEFLMLALRVDDQRDRDEDADRLLAVEWHVVVLDESQAIKNPATKAMQVACKLKARHRLCLTGTPVASSTDEQNCSAQSTASPNEPLEILSYTPPANHVYYLAVYRYSALVGTPNLEIITFNDALQYRVTAGSLLQPADRALDRGCGICRLPRGLSLLCAGCEGRNPAVLVARLAAAGRIQPTSQKLALR